MSFQGTGRPQDATPDLILHDLSLREWRVSHEVDLSSTLFLSESALIPMVIPLFIHLKICFVLELEQLLYLKVDSGGEL